jgi:hypothetical protein
VAVEVIHDNAESAHSVHFPKELHRFSAVEVMEEECRVHDVE